MGTQSTLWCHSHSTTRSIYVAAAQFGAVQAARPQGDGRLSKNMAYTRVQEWQQSASWHADSNVNKIYLAVRLGTILKVPLAKRLLNSSRHQLNAQHLMQVEYAGDKDR
jgi:hypothetical protein